MAEHLLHHLRFAPEFTAMLAAVCRRSCTRRPASPHALIASSQWRCRKLELRSVTPDAVVKRQVARSPKTTYKQTVKQKK